jgi:DNA-binding LytR/AlgR family response regulator
LKDGAYKIRVTIQALEDYFKEKDLLRVHRSYLVNPKRILSINKHKNNEIKLLVKDLRGEIAMIPIGRSYHDKIKSALPGLFPA